MFLRNAEPSDVVSKSELEQFRYTDIHRIVSRIPGVYISEEDGLGLRPNIGVRGTGSLRMEKLNVMEDGILIAPAPYASPAAYYSPTAGRMESIEVRKGSTQIKHGPFTTGGSLNYIST
ncbi:ferric citrate transporter FecA, partial [bacterium]|nr:ferric citrate transporter FecA [bacterium]